MKTQKAQLKRTKDLNNHFSEEDIQLVCERIQAEAKQHLSGV